MKEASKEWRNGRFSRSLVTRYAHHPLLSRPDRAQPGALRAASGRGRGWVRNGERLDGRGDR